MTEIHPNKRKATDILIEGDSKEELNQTFDLISSLLQKHEEMLASYEDIFENINDNFASLAKKVDELQGKVTAFESAPAESPSDEGWSDDEESVVDVNDNWTTMFRQLREYKIMHGDCRVPRNFSANRKLAMWVKNNRKLKVTNSKPERIIKLDSIGFYWGIKFPPPVSWDEMFEQLNAYKERMGNCNVPHNFDCPTALAKWAAYQRSEYKRFKTGRDSLLTLDKIGKLKELGINWKGPRL